ncbi:MAG: phosphatidate cytidylyltransferase [Oscillospiraceae bacterium]|nr:phosphatidate cytidylyltransferase [Oscillospiraceae bacterium]
MQEFLHGIFVFAAYLIPAAIIMLLVRKFIKIPDELFRKILHFILLGAYIPLVFAFAEWWMAAIFAAALIVVLFPALSIAEKIPMFSAFVNERKKGEFKSSMVLAVGMMVFSVCVCWGIFADKMLTLACVYAWGVGDAFAALAGKRFGKHKINLPLADKKKSWEGTAAMILSSFLSVAIVLAFRGGLGIGEVIVVSLLVAAVSSYVELVTKGGYDTLTCPIAAMAVIIPLVNIMGG